MNPNNLDQFLDSNETATLNDAEVNHIYKQVVEYAKHAVFAELDMLSGQLENVADELTDDWTPVSVDENDESFPDWQAMNKEILRVMEEARKNVIRSLTSAFERIKKFNEDQSRVTGSEAVQSRKVKAVEKMAKKNNQNGLDSKTLTVNEAKTFAKEHGVSGFNKVKNDIISIIKDNPDLSKNLQSVADTVYNYIYNDVPDTLQDEAEMLADQLLEKYSGVITTEEQDKAMGRGPTDSKELKKAMDRSVGLESGIFDGIKKKIGDKIANQWNKENEKWRKEDRESEFKSNIVKYKRMLKDKFINWYSTKTETYGPGVNAKTYLDIYTKQVIKKIKLDLISDTTEINDEILENTIKRYTDEINSYAESLYNNIEKYMKD